ncbi:glutamine synthetase [Candidatus Planktophila dulcis]|uniref:Glutamine synthetase n=1 Tax=Candidatus Planktophila dulcis TaxID=1884914 RepID=A0AAD0E225_9ACTN|nr:MFS transporter [Candidatus Planktophila dulcis]ASY12272.1 glutamine synthetase [Candidatus Planktophila dulcis]
MAKQKIHPGWIAVTVTFFTLMASAGYRSAPSVLIVPLEDAFGWSRSQISLAVSINVLLFGLVAPFAAALMERFTVRKVVMSALTLVAISSTSTIFMTQPWHLWALWGVGVGVGTGSMALVFAATIANRWFVARKGIVIGALTAATASGQLVFLPMLSYFAINYGWKSVSLTVGTAAALVIPFIYFFLKEKPEALGMTPYGAPSGWQPPAPNELSAGRIAIDTLRVSSKSRDFWILFGTFLVCGLSTNGLIGTHFIPAAHDHGMAETVAAGLLALIGLFDVIGTLFSGYLTDRIDPRKLLFFYYGLRGLSLFLLPSILFSSVHPSTLVFVIFYGLDWVATVPPTLVLCRMVMGNQRSAVVYGWVFVGHQIGASIAALGAAVLRVKLGDYAAAFYISGAMCLVASFAVLQIAKGKSTAELRG